jgi:subtilisin family serine protease
VVDTRLFTHPWLAGAYVAAADDLILGSAAKKLPEAADHATFVTGIVLRQAPGAVVELRTGLADDGSQDSWSVARTIADLVSNSTNVVNLSLGCTTEDGQPPLVLAAALAALGPRTLVVAAAGNHGNDGNGAPRPVWPAALDNVVAVGALDGSIPATFTPQAVWVDAMAQGVNVVSTSDTKRDGSVAFATWSGTSFAAAAVTGAVAARITDGRTASEAWQKLQDEYPADPGGRVMIPLNTLPDWPPDGVAPKRSHATRVKP